MLDVSLQFCYDIRALFLSFLSLKHTLLLLGCHDLSIMVHLQYALPLPMRLSYLLACEISHSDFLDYAVVALIEEGDEGYPFVLLAFLALVL